MVRRAQLAAVVVGFVLVVSAAGYGIARGVTAKDYSAYNKCVEEYINYISRRGGHAIEGGAFCHSYLPD